MIDILVIEDNKEIGELLSDFLVSEGFSVKICCTGEEGLAFFREKGAKLVVLDVMLPGINGFEVCRKIRVDDNTPVIILSARTEKEDKLNGLLLGADDYMEKPYDVDILIAKVKGIFKRHYNNDTVISGDISLDRQGRRCTVDSKELQLTVKEFELLKLLMENSGRTLTKEFIFNKIWGFDSFSEPQTLTVHIKWLREKIESNPKEPVHIKTVWGIGYKFE